MCGIAGFYNTDPDFPADQTIVKNMVKRLAHRGPDDKGFYCKDNIALGQCRLSIIDIQGGRQPIYNENKTVCVVFNGEIFNYLELRTILEKKGHRFYTHSDTEVLVHLYEEHGKDFISHLNGQFAIALWNKTSKELIIARDRVGIRPLFYTVKNGTLLFASEMKSLFAYPGVFAEIDPAGLNQVFTLWANIPPRTVFKNILELPAGHFLLVSPRGVQTHRYWKITFPDEKEYEKRPLKYYTERVHELVYDAVALRLRADVPVAAYLSGGLDSSIITSLVKKHHNNDLITFSVSFADENYDEYSHQMTMVNYLKTDHRTVKADYVSIGDAFSDVVLYAEKPIMRTAPAPLYILSRLVRENNIKVVLTGEGADEIFGGYNIFKEDKIRRFWAQIPESKIRPLLLSSIYPYVNRRSQAFWQTFFKKGLTDTENPYYSHLIRWNNTNQIKRLFHGDLQAQFNQEEDIYASLDEYVDPDILRWHPLCRAQYLEISLFMSGYLLNSQGDRMMMGNSVEGRFPFLDHHVIEFASTIPPEYKLHILNEKHILKKTFSQYMPKSISQRKKQPYRAPISRCFMDPDQNIGSSMLSVDRLENYGYFNAEKVQRLISRIKKVSPENIGERDDMSIAGIVSLQLLHYHFVDNSQE